MRSIRCRRNRWETPLCSFSLRSRAAHATGSTSWTRQGLKSGSVYRALSRLEEFGLTRSKWENARIAIEEKRPRRRYYEITARGTTELASTRDALQKVVDKLAPQKS